MKKVAKPKVFISYTWRSDAPSNPNDKPKERVLELADRLRAAGLDSMIDQYCLLPDHGFETPYRRPGDKVEPWVIWAGAQIQDADFCPFDVQRSIRGDFLQLAIMGRLDGEAVARCARRPETQAPETLLNVGALARNLHRVSPLLRRHVIPCKRTVTTL